MKFQEGEERNELREDTMNDGLTEVGKEYTWNGRELRAVIEYHK